MNANSQVAVQNNSLKSRLFTKVRIWLPWLLVMIYLRSRTRSNFKETFQVWRVVKGWSRLLGRERCWKRHRKQDALLAGAD